MGLIELLRDAVSDLTDTPEGMHMSLLDTLRECVYTGTEKGSGKSSFGSKPLISVGAWDLLNEIEQTWKQQNLSLEQSLRQLPNRAIAQDDYRITRDLYKSMKSIVKAINDLLDPPRRLHVSAQCPVCETRTVFRPDDGGEMVQQAALIVDGIKGCECLACGSVWAVNALEALAVDLGCAPL